MTKLTLNSSFKQVEILLTELETITVTQFML